MTAALVQLLGGGVLLYLGAEWLVGGASRLALSLRVPQLIVGLTIVAYGTSMPEAIVGIEAALAGHGDVALGNIIGSNIANLGLILGLSALLFPARVAGELRLRELPVLFAATVGLVLVLLDGQLSRWEGAGLLAASIAYTGWMIGSARSGAILARAGGSVQAADAGGTAGASSRARQLATAACGLGVLVLGGNLLVTGATVLALALGMSERVVGLTIVSLGTSLPELVTCLVAGFRGHSDIAIGNVMGSNIFNVLLCLGGVGVLGGVAVDPRGLRLELIVLALITLIGLILLRKARTLHRLEGLLLLLTYVAFLVQLAL